MAMAMLGAPGTEVVTETFARRLPRQRAWEKRGHQEDAREAPILQEPAREDEKEKFQPEEENQGRQGFMEARGRCRRGKEGMTRNATCCSEVQERAT